MVIGWGSADGYNKIETPVRIIERKFLSSQVIIWFEKRLDWVGIGKPELVVGMDNENKMDEMYLVPTS